MTIRTGGLRDGPRQRGRLTLGPAAVLTEIEMDRLAQGAPEVNDGQHECETMDQCEEFLQDGVLVRFCDLGRFFGHSDLTFVEDCELVLTLCDDGGYFGTQYPWAKRSTWPVCFIGAHPTRLLPVSSTLNRLRQFQ